MVSMAFSDLSEFESSALSWYWENAMGWAAKAGIMADSFRQLRLTGLVRSLFLRAMQKIESMYDEIRDRESKRG